MSDKDNEINDIINNNTPSEDELNIFKNNVQEWFNLDNTIRKLIIALKERKVYQKKLNENIQEFMFKYKYNDLNTQNGRLKANIKNVQKPVNMKEIKDKIILYKDLSGPQLLDKIFNSDERPIIEKKIIRRVIPRVSMSLDI
jgi:hypothetical protein